MTTTVIITYWLDNVKLYNVDLVIDFCRIISTFEEPGIRCSKFTTHWQLYSTVAGDRNSQTNTRQHLKAASSYYQSTWYQLQHGRYFHVQETQLGPSLLTISTWVLPPLMCTSPPDLPASDASSRPPHTSPEKQHSRSLHTSAKQQVTIFKLPSHSCKTIINHLHELITLCLQNNIQHITFKTPSHICKTITNCLQVLIPLQESKK